jgi:hypothetical protein
MFSNEYTPFPGKIRIRIDDADSAPFGNRIGLQLARILAAKFEIATAKLT